MENYDRFLEFVQRSKVVAPPKLGIGYVHGVNGIGSGCSLSTSVAAIMTKMVLTAITITNGTNEKLLVFIPHQSFQVHLLPTCCCCIPTSKPCPPSPRS